jgi:hypothetical protein
MNPNDWDLLTREQRIRRLRAMQPFWVTNPNRLTHSQIASLRMLKWLVFIVLTAGVLLYILAGS